MGAFWCTRAIIGKQDSWRHLDLSGHTTYSSDHRQPARCPRAQGNPQSCCPAAFSEDATGLQRYQAVAHRGTTTLWLQKGWLEQLAAIRNGSPRAGGLVPLGNRWRDGL